MPKADAIELVDFFKAVKPVAAAGGTAADVAEVLGRKPEYVVARMGQIRQLAKKQAEATAATKNLEGEAATAFIQAELAKLPKLARKRTSQNVLDVLNSL